MTIKYELPNPTPGEMLLEEFMKPMGLTAYRLANDIHVPISRIDDIISGKRGITADTAMRLGRYLGTTPKFWLNVQTHYDLMEQRRNNMTAFESITPFAEKSVK
jgi:antitoxin HigA-1